MQPTGIKSAQLLLEVIAGAQDKIGQDISKSGFSEQLSEQHQLIQNNPFGQPASAIDQANHSQKLSAPARNLIMSKWRAAQELAFTDPMALEKVLVKIHLAPSVRTAIKSAFNDQGKISLQELNEILDRAASAKSDLPADGKATSDEIQSLLAGMVQQQQSSVQNLRDLGIRLKGSYDFGEFRDLLRRLVDQTASGKLEQSARSPLQRTPEIDSATDKPAADTPSTSRARLPNQTLSLTANLIPSFLREEQEPVHDANSRTTTVAPSVLNGDGISKIRILAVDEIGQKEGLFGDQRSKHLNAAANSVGADVDSASLASIASTAGGLQRVSPTLISETVLNTPSEVVPDSASETKTLQTEGLQPTKVIEENIITATNLNQGLPSTDTEGLQQETTLAPGNLASNGEAVIRGLRMDRVQNGPNSDSNLFEGTLSDRPSTPAAEKIAAPASAKFTSDQSDSSENRAFSSNDTAMSSNGYAERPFGTRTEPATSQKDVPDRPAEYAEEIFRDVIRFHIESSPTDMRQKAAVSNSTGIGQADKPILNGTYQGSNANSEFSLAATLLDLLPIKAVPEQPNPVQLQSAVGSGGDASLGSPTQSPLQKVSALEEQNGAYAKRIAEQSDAGKPSIVVTSASTETRSNVHASFSQETLPGEARPELQNSVELLARTEAASEATAGKNGTASKEVADQATRSTSLETSVKETPTDKNAEKVSPGTNTSGQFSQHDQGQESALSFYRDGVQVTSVAAAPSAQSAPEMLSYYASPLTVELAQRIKELYKQKNFQFTLELQPKHLGRLVVRIGTDAKLVKASITTESEQARELLSRSSSLLRQELASQGLVLEQLQIDVHSHAAAHDQLFQKHSDGSRRNTLSRQSASSDKGSTEPSARRAQIGHADTLISVFV